MDESLPEAHLALAVLKKDAWNWAGAEAEFKRSIELNPKLARAHTNFATLLAVLGQDQQANAEASLGRELDPFFTGSNWRLGWQLYLARHYDEAIEQFKRTLELDPNHVISHVHLGHIYTAKGQYQQAIAEYREAIKLGDDTASNQICLGYALAMPGDRSEGLAILKELRNTTKYVSPAELAILYIGLGEKEQAVAALERAFAAHDPQMQYLNLEPRYDSLRSDSRFQDLVRRVGLPQRIRSSSVWPWFLEHLLGVTRFSRCLAPAEWGKSIERKIRSCDAMSRSNFCLLHSQRIKKGCGGSRRKFAQRRP